MSFQLLGRLQLRVRYSLLLFVCWGFGVLPAESAPPLPQEDWFNPIKYKAAAVTIENHFDDLNKGPILSMPTETRLWPEPGDPEFGLQDQREQVKMSHMFENVDGKNSMQPGVHPVSDNPGSAMWLTVQGDFRNYMLERSDQWDPSITNHTSDSPRSVYNRGAAALGMLNGPAGFGYFPYVADLWIDVDAIFRTGLFQDWGSVDSMTPQKPISQDLANWVDDKAWEPWLNKWPNIDPSEMAIARGVPAEDLTIESGNAQTYADWYNGWWVAQTQSGAFPWTGHGYTYDWAYLDQYPNAQGLTEFVVMPSTHKGNVFHYEVISFENTLDYVMIPEPSSLLLVLLGLIFVPLQMRRR
ncbi:MAG: PEP-CTERM sorting domain-containing protein [Pirellulaceae bacterium]|nr:PEP-CTERM sorting domain-containing protein [Pirellulaceae bacterium]